MVSLDAAAFAMAADLLDPPHVPPNPYLTDPVGWAEDRLGDFLWSKQQQICRSVVEHRRTAVKSCHEVGKSWTASRVVGWWIDTHPPGTATVVTTAPTFPQVRGILWKEIRRAHAASDLAGRCNQTEWWIGDHMAAFGRKPSDYDENAFQGIHDEFMLVVIDEACGVPEQLWVAALSLIADGNGRILAIGNPDDPNSHFAKVCQPGSGWNVIQIAAKDSPNFTDEKVPAAVRSKLISQLYLDDMASDVGVGSALWMSKVEGEFPSDTPDGVVSSSALARCRVAKDHAPEDLLPVELGCDIGGSEEGDQTAVWERRGVKAGRSWHIRSSDSEEVADLIQAAIIESGATAVKVDSIGIGWGVSGSLARRRREGKHQASVVKVNVGSASHNTKRWPKLRDELWWEVARCQTERGDWDLSEIDDRTAADLTAPRWSPTATGQIKVEPKDGIRQRLGRSPDDGDGLLLAFYAGGHGAAWGEAWDRMAETTEEMAGEPEPEPTPPEPTPPEPATPAMSGSLGRLSDLQRRR